MTKICTFVLVEIFKIEVAQLTDIVSKGRNKKRKKKTKRNKKTKRKKEEKYNERREDEKTRGNLRAYEISVRNRYDECVSL